MVVSTKHSDNNDLKKINKSILAVSCQQDLHLLILKPDTS